MIVTVALTALLGYFVLDKMGWGSNYYNHSPKSPFTAGFISAATFCMPVESPTQMFWWNWCIW